MPAQIKPPVIKTFTLTEVDKFLENEGTPTTLTVRQAKQREFEKREALYGASQIVTRMGPEGLEIAQTVSYQEQMRIETGLVFEDCDLLAVDGSRLFDTSKRSFDEAWASLDEFICEEMHKCVLEVNPTWAPPKLKTANS